MKKLNLLFGAVLGMLLCAGLVAAAAVSPALSIQGKLTSAQGYPLSGSYPVQFRIFNDATGGTSLWNTNQTVPVTKGIWQTYISPPATLDFNQRLWLEVTVNGETLSPRSELTFGSWSFAASRLLPTIWDIITTGKVGVGTSTPTEKLDVSGNIKVTSNITAGGKIFAEGGQHMLGFDRLALGYYNSNNAGYLAIFQGPSSWPNMGTRMGYIGWATDSLYIKGEKNNLVKVGSDLSVTGSGTISGDATIGGNAIVNGGVGIGTSDPGVDTKLNVTGGDAWFGGSVIANYMVGIGTRPTNKLDVSGGAAIGSYAGTTTAPSSGLIVSGKVGIGVASPDQLLQVNGIVDVSSGGAPQSTGVSGVGIGYNSGNYGWIQSYGSRPLTLNPLGNNVGIGLTNAESRLDVAGSAILLSGGAAQASNHKGEIWYDGSALHLYAYDAGGIYFHSAGGGASPTTEMTLNGLGNLGIGVGAPGCCWRLSVKHDIGGVYGYAIKATDLTYGIYGRADSNQGTGVFGYAASTTGVTYGVYGQASSPSGYGLGTADNAYVGKELKVGGVASETSKIVCVKTDGTLGTCVGGISGTPPTCSCGP